jgi:hypothetical protein
LPRNDSIRKVLGNASIYREEVSSSFANITPSLSNIPAVSNISRANLFPDFHSALGKTFEKGGIALGSSPLSSFSSTSKFQKSPLTSTPVSTISCPPSFSAFFYSSFNCCSSNLLLPSAVLPQVDIMFPPLSLISFIHYPYFGSSSILKSFNPSSLNPFCFPFSLFFLKFFINSCYWWF